jgi:hypothetical protein
MLERGEKMEFEAVVSAKKATDTWRLLLGGAGSPKQRRAKPILQPRASETPR